VSYNKQELLRQQPFSYLRGAWDFFEKKYFNALADQKKFRFCIVAEKKFMLSPARIFFI
jgi:hypothetical protein